MLLDNRHRLFEVSFHPSTKYGLLSLIQQKESKGDHSESGAVGYLKVGTQYTYIHKAIAYGHMMGIKST